MASPLMVAAATRTSPTEVLELLELVREVLRAKAARFHVADYSLRRLQQIDASGRVNAPQAMTGTLIGQVFTSGKIRCTERPRPWCWFR